MGLLPCPLLGSHAPRRFLRRPPDRLRRRRHVDLLVPQRVGDGVDHGRRRRNGPGLAAALDAQRVRRAWRHRHTDLEGRQVVGARHAVVHVARCQELPALVVDGAFQQRLADTLGDAAVHLAFHDHRVDEIAEVVDGHPALDARRAGGGIHLQLAHVHARGEREIGGIVERPLLQPRFELRAREFVRDIGL